MLAMGSSVVDVLAVVGLGLGLLVVLTVDFLVNGLGVVVVVVLVVVIGRLLVVGRLMGVVKAGGGSVGADVDVFRIDGLESSKGNRSLVRSGIWDKSRVGRLLPEDFVLLGVVVVVVRGLGLLVDFLVIGFFVVDAVVAVVVVVVLGLGLLDVLIIGFLVIGLIGLAVVVVVVVVVVDVEIAVVVVDLVVL